MHATAPTQVGAPPEGDDFELSTALTAIPAPLTVSQNENARSNATVEVLVTNGTRSDVEFSSLSIAFSVADSWSKDGAAILTCEWGKCDTKRYSLPAGWKRCDDPGPGRLKFSPETAVGLKQGESVWVRVADIPVSAKPGATPVTITLDRSDTSPSTTISLGKFPQGFHLRDLRAAAPVVAYGGQTVLTWAAPYDPTVTYTLLANGEPVELRNENGKYNTHITRILSTTTVYELRAELQEHTGVMHALSLPVHVVGGDVTAHTIQAKTIHAEKELSRGGSPAVCVRRSEIPLEWDEQDSAYLGWAAFTTAGIVTTAFGLVDTASEEPHVVVNSNAGKQTYNIANYPEIEGTGKLIVGDGATINIDVPEEPKRALSYVYLSPQLP